MLRLTILSLSFLIHSSLLAFDEYKANYGVYLLGTKIADETRILKRDKDIYILSSIASTSDLGKLFGDRKIVSKSIINFANKFIDLESFTSKETEKNKLIEIIRVAFKKHGKLIISSQLNKHNSTETFELGLKPLDPLSSSLILSEALKKNINFSEKKYIYSNGKKNRMISINKLDKQVMKYKEKDYEVIPLKLSDEENSIIFFYAPSLKYAPIEIEKQTKNKMFSYKLENLEFYK